MKGRSASSNSGIFLAELLIAILVFSVVSAICTSIFIAAKETAEDSRILNHAVNAAQSGAECFKAACGDLDDVAALLSAARQTDANYVDLFLGPDWDTAGQIDPNKAEYVMRIEYISNHGGYVDGKVSIMDKQGTPIYSLTVSALEGML